MKTANFLAAITVIWVIFTGVALADDHSRDKEKYRAKLYGIIEAMPADGYEGSWIIGGNPVNVYNKTEINERHGRAVTGRYVEAKGEWIGEKFVALSIEVEEDESFHSRPPHAKFYGTVEAMPQGGVAGTWRVNGRELFVSRDTRIKEKYGSAAIGAYVEVEGDFSGARFVAHEIEVKDSSRHNSQKAYNRILSDKSDTMP